MIDSAEEFVRLRNGEDPFRAAHDEAPLHVWQEVIARFPGMRFWVAQNKTVPVEILAVLAGDQDSQVRWMVASKRKLPEYLQLQLAHDPDESVRHRIACNAKTTKVILELLVNDSWSVVRETAN